MKCDSLLHTCCALLWFVNCGTNRKSCSKHCLAIEKSTNGKMVNFICDFWSNNNQIKFIYFKLRWKEKNFSILQWEQKDENNFYELQLLAVIINLVHFQVCWIFFCQADIEFSYFFSLSLVLFLSIFLLLCAPLNCKCEMFDIFLTNFHFTSRDLSYVNISLQHKFVIIVCQQKFT